VEAVLARLSLSLPLLRAMNALISVSESSWTTTTRSVFQQQGI
jgi:hypothetical protein